MDGIHDPRPRVYGEELVGNTLPGTVTKLLTLVPIVVAVSFFDLPRFSAIFTSARLLPFFVVAASLFALGVAMKWRILRVRLELSMASFSVGLVLLVGSVALYIYGSYSANKSE